VHLILILNILKDLRILFLIFLPVNFCSATMAHKKDKGKSNALILKSESNVAHASPVSAIDLANRFAPFGSEYPASYFNTLAALYGPFADVS
jgi:flagellar biosynthesis/type III secretory pathway ATPase